MNIITENKINLVVDYFKDYDKFVIFGKGPTFKEKKKEIKEYYACVNNTINFINDCDILICNDVESFDKINLKKLNNLKFIIIPYHIHLNKKWNKLITYNDIIKKIKDYFKGSLIIYNLNSSNIKYNDYISLESKISSSNNMIDFICKYLKNIKKIDLYGIGIEKNYEYNNIFLNKEKSSPYNYNYINKIRTHIINICTKNNLEFKLN